jgi:protein SCO1/2
MLRPGPAARAAVAIAVVVAGASIGLLAGSASRGAPARAAGLRAAALPSGLERRPAPRIRLRDAHGDLVDTASLRGRPYLVAFVYTRCRDVCPVIGNEIGDAFRRLGRRARGAAALLVSVDPRHDTPRAAIRWMRVHGLPREARYLLGSSTTLLPVWRRWWVAPESGAFDPTTHDAGVGLVDTRGRLRGRWSGSGSIAPGDLAHDLATLEAEPS